MLPEALYTCAQTRALDRSAIDQGIPGIVLMKRAGKSAFEQIQRLWPNARSMRVFCGAGNNGGDGYVIAALASQRNWHVELYWVADPQTLKGDAARAYAYACQENVVAKSAADCDWSAIATGSGGVIVDALLGTGFRGQLRPEIADVCAKMNASPCPVMAMDIPSGLDGDSGVADEHCIEAAATVTFVGMKRGLLTGAGPAMCGELFYDALGIPEAIFDTIPPQCKRASHPSPMPRRRADAHKGDFGHVLVVGGDLGMGGAAMMSAEAAMRCGAGLVTLATRPEHVPACLARLPEVMAVGIDAGPILEELIDRASVVVVGPGLGLTGWSQQLLYFALSSEKPTVIDADGLNLLSELCPEPGPRNWVITPHPGEAARLLKTSTAEVQADRFAAAAQLANTYSAVTLLKGAGTIIADADHMTVAQVGSPAMACAGMGDVLTGVIGALIAQGFSSRRAAIDGVCIHGQAAVIAAAGDHRGLRATDLMLPLRQLVNGTVSQ